MEDSMDFEGNSQSSFNDGSQPTDDGSQPSPMVMETKSIPEWIEYFKSIACEEQEDIQPCDDTDLSIHRRCLIYIAGSVVMAAKEYDHWCKNPKPSIYCKEHAFDCMQRFINVAIHADNAYSEALDKATKAL